MRYVSELPGLLGEGLVTSTCSKTQPMRYRVHSEGCSSSVKACKGGWMKGQQGCKSEGRSSSVKACRGGASWNPIGGEVNEREGPSAS